MLFCSEAQFPQIESMSRVTSRHRRGFSVVLRDEVECDEVPDE